MIRLIDDYVINISGNQYVLAIDEHKIDKQGKAVHTAIGYYTTITAAIKAAAQDCYKRRLDNSIYSLEEAIGIIKSINARFESAANTFFGTNTDANTFDKQKCLDCLERTLDTLIYEMNICLHTFTDRDGRLDIDGYTSFLKERMFDYTELLREEAENENNH